MTKNDPVLVLASGNAGKIREFQAMFSHLNVHVESQKTFGVKPCPEPFHTFIENCLAKARHAAKETGRPAMADDSGLCVDALGGAPGVYSARFAGEDATRTRQQLPVDGKTAWRLRTAGALCLRAGCCSVARRPRAPHC